MRSGGLNDAKEARGVSGVGFNRGRSLTRTAKGKTDVVAVVGEVRDNSVTEYVAPGGDIQFNTQLALSWPKIVLNVAKRSLKGIVVVSLTVAFGPEPLDVDAVLFGLAHPATRHSGHLGWEDKTLVAR